MNMENFLNTLGWLGWIIGIAAAWLEWNGYRNQQRTEKAFEEILTRAQQDWEGQYTEKQVLALTAQLEELQMAVSEEVPRLAKRVYIDEQLNSLAQSIAKSYDSYNDLTRELSRDSEEGPLPPELVKEINRSIIPKYRIQQRQQQMVYRFLIWLSPIVVILLGTLLIPLLPGRIEINYTRVPIRWLAVFFLLIAIGVYAIAVSFWSRILELVQRNPSIAALLGIPFFFISVSVIFGLVDFAIPQVRYTYPLSYGEPNYISLFAFAVVGSVVTSAILVYGAALFSVMSSRLEKRHA